MARKTVTLRPHEVPVTRYPEGASGIAKTRKKRISPVTLTITVSFDKLNENGTLSGANVVNVKGLKGAYVVAPIQSGGGMYAKVESLVGINVLGDVDDTSARVQTKRKLF